MSRPIVGTADFRAHLHFVGSGAVATAVACAVPAKLPKAFSNRPAGQDA